MKKTVHEKDAYKIVSESKFAFTSPPMTYPPWKPLVTRLEPAGAAFG